MFSSKSRVLYRVSQKMCTVCVVAEEDEIIEDLQVNVDEMGQWSQNNK